MRQATVLGSAPVMTFAESSILSLPFPDKNFEILSCCICQHWLGIENFTGIVALHGSHNRICTNFQVTRRVEMVNI